MEPLEITCPPCQKKSSERFYGPCTSCRNDLAATMRIEARESDQAAFEPKMNVVPNQVATKE